MTDIPPKATRVYLGNCPKCNGLAIFTAVWQQGEDEMLTVIDCISNDHNVIAKVNALQASGQPQRLQQLYIQNGIKPFVGPVYTVTENCTLEPDQ